MKANKCILTWKKWKKKKWFTFPRWKWYNNIPFILSHPCYSFGRFFPKFMSLLHKRWWCLLWKQQKTLHIQTKLQTTNGHIVFECGEFLIFPFCFHKLIFSLWGVQRIRQLDNPNKLNLKFKGWVIFIEYGRSSRRIDKSKFFDWS